MNTTNLVIADTSALVSLVSTTDSNHEQALTLSQQLQEQGIDVLVPWEIFAELMNVLGRLQGHAEAAAVGGWFLDPPGSQRVVVIDTPEATRRLALAAFGAQRSSASFTDCIVMAVADWARTKSIFGFDAVFQKRGYRLPGSKAA